MCTLYEKKKVVTLWLNPHPPLHPQVEDVLYEDNTEGVCFSNRRLLSMQPCVKRHTSMCCGEFVHVLCKFVLL